MAFGMQLCSPLDVRLVRYRQVCRHVLVDPSLAAFRADEEGWFLVGFTLHLTSQPFIPRWACGMRHSISVRNISSVWLVGWLVGCLYFVLFLWCVLLFVFSSWLWYCFVSLGVRACVFYSQKAIFFFLETLEIEWW